MSIISKFNEYINASLDGKIADLRKAEEGGEDLSKAVNAQGEYTRKGLLFDPFMDSSSLAGGLFKQKNTMLSNGLLKQVSRRSPIVSSWLDTRCGQVAACCKKPANRFDMGFKFNPKDAETKTDLDEIRRAEEFLLNTGKQSDRDKDTKMTFDQWGHMVARDFLVYGHAAIEKVRTRDGSLHSFPPLPGETIYYANKNVNQDFVKKLRDSYRSVVDANNVKVEEIETGKYEYVQVIDGKVIEGFTDSELIFGRFNMESDIELRGYSMGPLEKAISAITSHLQIENHQKQFFTYGAAARGILVIQGDVTPNQIRALQSQWTQQITGPMNSWRTPIFGGIEGVQWVSLQPSNRDMEFAAYQDHILRTMFACFAIDPEEVGFGYLSKGVEQRSLAESSNEWKITASRDRGLRPLLGRIEAIINEEILPAYDSEFAKKYHFTFVGLDSETEQEETQRLQQETALHTTVGEARKQIEKPLLKFGNELILNPLLVQTLRTSMYFGDWLEHFIGVPGASQRPDLQFIDNPSWFQWQQMQMQMMQQQAAAQAGAPAPDGGGAPGEGDEAPQGGEPGQEEGMTDQQAQEQAEQAQQTADAVSAYIDANPELFKAMKKNLAEAGRGDFLAKSERKPRRIRDTHVDVMVNQLAKDFRHGSNLFMKEIFEALKEEVDQAKGA